jgi:hypothetical protein
MAAQVIPMFGNEVLPEGQEDWLVESGDVGIGRSYALKSTLEYRFIR